MRAIAHVIVLACILLSSAAAHADRCGAERWPVKVGSDATASGVRLAPRDTTIRELVALPHPRKLPTRRRVPGVETSAQYIANPRG